MVPRDAGLLEGSTGMGLSLSLLAAAVSLDFSFFKKDTLINIRKYLNMMLITT